MLSVHLTVLLTKMVQWTAGVKIITSEQTKTLHPWLVPVSSFAATHASMFVLFTFFLLLLCCCCCCFLAFGPFPSVIHVQIKSFLCFTLHAWLTTNATFITQNELVFKSLLTTGPLERKKKKILYLVLDLALFWQGRGGYRHGICIFTFLFPLVMCWS